jgi:actin-like ATPase involved in cell morphogenesis
VGYSLGIDVGTTFTAAAMWRDGRVEVVALETHRVTVPTVVYAAGDEVAFGDAAVGRMTANPAGGAREFKRRLGDSVPLMLSGAPYSADRLVAMFAAWVVRSVTEQFGERPERIVLTHPANWTEFQLHLFRSAVQQAGLDGVEMVSEPQAAAHDFGAAAHSAPGDLVVVYDLGGGTFDVALLRCTPGGFEHVGESAGIERLGGIDFDEAVFEHVVGHVPREVLAAARRDSAGPLAFAQLRRACVEAKEALSSEIAVDVPVMLPGHTATVRLTRSEFEQMISPMLGQTIELVRQVVRRSELAPEDLSAVLLVGGSSRIPLVSDLVGREIGAPVRVDAHPKLVVARGAARWAGTRPAPAVGPTRESRSRRTPIVIAAAVIGLAAVGGGIALLAGGGSGGDAAPDATESVATVGLDSTVAGSGAPQTSATASTATASTATASTATASTAPASTEPAVSFPRITGARLVGSVAIPADAAAGGHAFGGISGLAFEDDGTLVALSDNDPAEGTPVIPAGSELADSAMYRLRLDLGDDRFDEGDIELLSTTVLLGPDGQPFVRQDGEAVAISDDGTVFVAIEGNSPEGLTAPLVRAFGPDGTFTRLIELPERYTPAATSGITDLGGLSSLTLFSGGDAPLLLGGFDYSLHQDLTGDEAPTDPRSVRLFALDPATDSVVSEFGYPLDTRPELIDGEARPRSLGGLFDLAAFDDGLVVAAEYAYEEDGPHLLLYELEVPPSSDAAPGDAPPADLEKSLIVDLADLGIDLWAFQGITRGPDLSDGRATLLLASDNEFGGADGTTPTTFVMVALDQV